MDLKLTGQKALVTGSTAGIGYAIAARLAAEGVEVWINGRTQARVDSAMASLRKEIPSAKVHGAAGDLKTKQDVDGVIAAAPDVDILVNNVGVFNIRSLAELTLEEWESIFAINVFSGALLSQHYLPRMLGRNRGRILFISSESALNIPLEMMHYGVSKAAQAALARGLAEMTRATAVTVNTVLAGPTKSEGVQRFVGDLARAGGKPEADVEKEFFQTMRPSSLLQRFADPAELANVVAFLASPLASLVNGAAVRAEGGVLKTVF